MITSLYQQLRTIPLPADREAYHQLAITTFFRLLDMLCCAEDQEHPARVALVRRFVQELMSQSRVPICLGGVKTIRVLPRFAAAHERTVPLIFLPGTYLEEVRSDPLQALGRMVALASRYVDALALELDAPATDRRAKAWEAELLVFLRLQHEQQGLTFTPNRSQQRLLKQFPQGLSSLPKEQAWPSLPITMARHGV
jgi:hypothetical protein